MNYRTPILFIAFVLVLRVSFAATCSKEDFDTHISGESQCLVMRRFGTSEPQTMIVWLHGDVSAGGPANYHFSMAERAALALANNNVLSVALVRPGYSDGSGDSSTVALLQSGRSDHYTKDNLTEVGVAIERLKIQFRPKKIIVIGHSGGAATAAVLLGLKPGLISGAVLVSCPCDISAWRTGRKGWPRSENPIRWVDKIDPSTHVIVIMGARDDNTLPMLGESYVMALAARNIPAKLQILPNESHNSAFASDAVLTAVKELVESK